MALSLIGFFCSMISVLAVSVTLLSAGLSLGSPHVTAPRTYPASTDRVTGSDDPWAAIAGGPMAFIKAGAETPQRSPGAAGAANNVRVEAPGIAKRERPLRTRDDRQARSTTADRTLAYDLENLPFSRPRL
jgi:hypothetical protein